MSVREIVREAEATIARLDREAKRERFLSQAKSVEWQPATKTTRLTGLDRGRLSVIVELPPASRIRPRKTRRTASPVTIRDKSGRVVVVSGETYKPKRKRKQRASKNRKVAYRLSTQRVKGSAVTFDESVMRRIGTIHEEH
jgi:hypothetical protein